MGRWVGADSALIAWVVLVAVIAGYVTGYDLWAWKTGHRMMTTQFRLWLHQEVAGPIIIGLWVGAFVGLSFHFLIRATK